LYINKKSDEHLSCSFCKEQITFFDYDRFFRCSCGAHYLYTFNFDYDEMPEIINDYILLISNEIIEIYSGLVDMKIDFRIECIDPRSGVVIIFLRVIKNENVPLSNHAFAPLGKCFSQN